MSSLDVSSTTYYKGNFLRQQSTYQPRLINDTAISWLQCNDNNLTQLNVKNGYNTKITSFTAVNNPNLECIQVDDAEYSTANWIYVDSQTMLQ
jgi:Leucine-rich repeat (LRR) protein